MDNSDTVRTWLFTSTIHRDGQREEDNSWKYHGTAAGALKEYQDLLNRSWSPFVTYAYHEQVDEDVAEEEVVVKCEVEGCANPGNPCYLPDITEEQVLGDGPHAWYCDDHIKEHGFCFICGQFQAGLESFEFVHADYCDNCWNQIENNFRSDNETEYYYEMPDEDD